MSPPMKRKSKADADEDYAVAPATPKRTKTIKSSTPKRGTKVKEETEEARKARIVREKKKAWKEELKNTLAWKVDPTFKFNQGMRTITKGEAKKQYKLNDEDLKALTYEQQVSGSGYLMKLYSIPQVQHVCRRKHGELPDTVKSVYEYLDKDFDGTGVTVTRVTKAAQAAWIKEDEAKSRKYADHLLRCLQRWVPDYAKSPTSYEPPKLGSTKDTLPENFAFRPSFRPITEFEAMNLFLLHQHELDGLERKTADNPVLVLDPLQILNYEEVQQRAMDCHGGFEGHNKIVLDLENKAVSNKRWDWKEFPLDLMTELALSPTSVKDLRGNSKLKDKVLLEVWWPPYDPVGDEFVHETCAPGHGDGCRMYD
ncbi:hypothetical protein EV421DRAFT_1815750 [Armillaria borealis]|uniref:Uncharacterized protein n=1 Tax=Armillaria borealis TaxID=47425 RepID=A0AA39JHF2_9AGAR|nr:hypothetical protein EV421DRAFT_1815750 [Armillaria borealis]